MTQSLAAAAPIMPSVKINAAPIMGYIVTALLLCGIAAVVVTASSAEACTGTALSAADIALPTIIAV